MQNNVCITAVKLNARKVSFHTYSCTHLCHSSTALYCIIDDALLKTMPDIDQALLLL